MGKDSVQDRLLQCCALRCTDRHYPETAASSEQCSSDCAPMPRRRSHAKPLLHQLYWLPVQQWITYKLAVPTYKVRSTSTPVYLHCQIAQRDCSLTLRSSAIPLLDQLFMRTDFSRRAFRSSAPSVWNSLPQTVLISDSLSVFKSRLKTLLFTQAFTEH